MPCFILPLPATTLPAGFNQSEIFGFSGETAGLTFAPDGEHLFVWDRDGRVWIVEDDVKLSTPFIDIRDEVGAWNDHGLLGFALDPNFEANGHVYLMYVVDRHHLLHAGTPSYNPAANEYHQATIGRITRYTANAADDFHTVDPASRLVLLGDSMTNGIPITHISHGVGSLLFAPDGTLLASTGDGAGGTDAGSDPNSYYQQALADGILTPQENVGSYRAQLPQSLSGKILRIDPSTGDGLPSNPFYDSAAPRAPQSRVWALGLRNPFRVKLRPDTGSHVAADADPGVLIVSDVGYFTWEEVSICDAPGQNFGWPIYEGYSLTSSHLGSNPQNQHAPNPLNGVDGCAEPYFRFKDLLVEETLGTPSWPNPCDPAESVPASIPTFMHARPILDWNHDSVQTRTATFDGQLASTTSISSSGSPVAGAEFSGRCSIGGVWYRGANFPASYTNKYFFADCDGQWIRTLSLDDNQNPVRVDLFATAADAVVDMAFHPVEGTLYFLSFWSYTVHKITYAPGGNLVPTAAIDTDANYGPGPLTVQFTGTNSVDPEGLPLTYSWDFGDGSPTVSEASPSHTFAAPPDTPTPYTVSLTVTDQAGASHTTSQVISVNNSPPTATIVSPPANSLYSAQSATSFDLIAEITDAEHATNQLGVQWQTILHHNDHFHPEPVDTNWTTTTLTQPLGCESETYWYRILLTVSDPAGLATTVETFLYPDCNTNNTPPVAAPDSMKFRPGIAAKIRIDTLLANDSDADGNVLFLAEAGPTSDAGGTVNTMGAWVHYVAPGGWDTNDTFTYLVSDGEGGSAQGTVTVELMTDTRMTPNLEQEEPGDGTVHLTFQGIPGRTYQIQYATDPQDPSWQPLATQGADTAGRIFHVDDPPEGASPRIYRTITP